MPMDHELVLMGLTLVFIIHQPTTRQRSINLSPRNNQRFDIARGASGTMPMEYPWIATNPCHQQSDVENCISLSKSPPPPKKKKKRRNKEKEEEDILGIDPNGWLRVKFQVLQQLLVQKWR